MGSKPTPRTSTKPDAFRILNLLLHLRKQGFRYSTLDGFSRRLRAISNNSDLDDPESVKEYIARLECSEGYKGNLVNCYNHYVRFYGLSWSKPFYNRVDRITRIPREQDINKVISHASLKYALAYSILRDTGMRPIELTWLRLKHIDLENGRVYPGSAKHGRGRILKLKPSTLAMLKRYVQCHNATSDSKIWTDTRRLRENWARLRKSVATKLSEPQLNHIRLYDLRHHYASLLYQKTKDIIHVQRQLGHRNIQNTLRYIHGIDLDAETFIVKIAVNVEQSTPLLEAGFTFVAVIEEKYVFRKPK